MLDVVFNHRRRGDIQRLKAMIDEGRLGRTYYAKAWWMRRTGIPTMGSWFTQSKLAGGGPLVDIGVHVLDYALFLLGNPGGARGQRVDLRPARPQRLRVQPRGQRQVRRRRRRREFDVEDLATVFMRLEDGGTLLLEASWAAHRADGDEFGVTLYGTEGGAELIVDDYAPAGSLSLRRRRRHGDRPAPAPPASAEPTRRSSRSSSTRSAPATGAATTAPPPPSWRASSTPATSPPPSEREINIS